MKYVRSVELKIGARRVAMRRKLSAMHTEPNVGFAKESLSKLP